MRIAKWNKHEKVWGEETKSHSATKGTGKGTSCIYYDIQSLSCYFVRLGELHAL